MQLFLGRDDSSRKPCHAVQEEITFPLSPSSGENVDPEGLELWPSTLDLQHNVLGFTDETFAVWFQDFELFKVIFCNT